MDRAWGIGVREICIGLLLAVLMNSGPAGAQTISDDFRLLQLHGRGVRWSGAIGEVKVTYAFVREQTRFADARNCEGMQPTTGMLVRSGVAEPAFKAEVAAAFAMWTRVANIDFREVDDPATAGILIGAQTSPEGHAFTDVKHQAAADGSADSIARALICLNPAKRWKIGFDGDLAVYDLRYTIAHEIGHAIGLDHPEVSDQLMSFRYREHFRLLQAGDVKGAALLYGSRPAFAERR